MKNMVLISFLFCFCTISTHFFAETFLDNIQKSLNLLTTLDESMKQQSLDFIKRNKNITNLINESIVLFDNLEDCIGECNKHYPALQQNFTTKNKPVSIESNRYLHKNCKIFIDDDVNFNCNNHSIYFSKDFISLIEIKENKTCYFQNVTFKEFSPSHISKTGFLIFDNKTFVEIIKNEDLKTILNFRGITKLNGKGKVLDMQNGGEIVVTGNNSILFLENITLKNLSNKALRCEDNSSKIVFGQNVKIILSDDFHFDIGELQIQNGRLKISGQFFFLYQSNQQFIIHNHSSLCLSFGTKFYYKPYDNNPNLLIFMSNTSQFVINGASLYTSNSGLNLIRGHLFITGANFFYNGDPNITDISQAIVFGDGINPENDFDITIMPGASLDIKSGFVDYKNLDIDSNEDTVTWNNVDFTNSPK